MQVYLQGWNALMFACDKGHLEIAQALLSHGANASDKSGKDYRPEEVRQKQQLLY